MPPTLNNVEWCEEDTHDERKTLIALREVGWEIHQPVWPHYFAISPQGEFVIITVRRVGQKMTNLSVRLSSLLRRHNVRVEEVVRRRGRRPTPRPHQKVVKDNLGRLIAETRAKAKSSPSPTPPPLPTFPEKLNQDEVVKKDYTQEPGYQEFLLQRQRYDIERERKRVEWEKEKENIPKLIKKVRRVKKDDQGREGE